MRAKSPTAPAAPVGCRRVGRRAVLGGTGLALAALASPGAWAAQRLLRIGTAGTGGTYYRVGLALAQGFTENAAPCVDGPDADHCGLPGTVAVAEISNGSTSNLQALAAGTLDLGFAQADISSWAYHGAGPFAGRQPLGTLRAIASLYDEVLHVVARADAGIRTVADLRGKRVSLDEPGSGTLSDARLLLRAYGIGEKDIRPRYVKPDIFATDPKAIDAFIVIAAPPVAYVADFAAATQATLVPVDDAQVRALLSGNRFLHPTTIPAGLYAGIGAVPTIAVGALLVATTALGEEAGYAITRALWSARIQRLLAGALPKTRLTPLARTLDSIDLPLHSGAERFYREAGLVH